MVWFRNRSHRLQQKQLKAKRRRLGRASKLSLEAMEARHLLAADLDLTFTGAELGNNQVSNLVFDGSKQLIVIDAGVPDQHGFVESVLNQYSGVEFDISLLDADSDGVDQLTGLLSNSSGKYSAVHIVSHGNSGQVFLGDTVLSSDSLGNYASQLSQWSAALSGDADVLLYGCNIANAAGESFLSDLRAATGADIAASDDLTGSARHGGDWNLEAEIGNVETSSLIVADWNGILAPPGLDLDSSDGDDPTVVAIDEFESGDGSGGSGSWSTDWQTSSSTDVQFVDGTMQLSDPDSGSEALRHVDLTGFTDAVVSFYFETSGNLEPDDVFVVEVSENGGNNWATVLTNSGDGEGFLFGIPVQTEGGSLILRVRWISGGGDGDEWVRIDDLAFEASPTGYVTTYALGSPAVDVTSDHVKITELDGDDIQSAIITLTNPQLDDTLSVTGSMPGGITASAYDSATGSMTLTGQGTLAVYENALEAIGFATSSTLLEDRFVSFTISDGVEQSPASVTRIIITEPGDWDNDTIPDVDDIDDDNDGILDINECPSSPCDTDGDGVDDQFDLDSDNDGISDLYESGASLAIIGADTDGNGVMSVSESFIYLQNINPFATAGDDDSDGLMDIFDLDTSSIDPVNSVGTVTIGSDGDSLDDYRDLDSDGDTIPDTIEARPTGSFAENDGFVDTADDSDGDGVIDLFDTFFGLGGTHANFVNPVNTDGDGLPDYRDTNSDDDEHLDVDEVNSFAAPSYTDPDGGAAPPFSRLPNIDFDPSDVDYRSLNDSIDLITVKTLDSSDATPSVGEIVSFLISVTNNDPTLTANNVSLVDTLPAGITYLTHSTAAGTYSTATGLWSVGDLVAGATVTLQLQGTIDAGEEENSITNETTAATSHLPDPTTDGDDLTETVVVPGAADLVTVKTLASSDSTPAEGDTVSFQITVTNDGPSDATNVSLVDKMPVGFTVTGGNGAVSQGSYDSASGLWTIGNLNVGDSATLTLEGLVEVGRGGETLTNITTAAEGDEEDPTTAGDDLTESVVVENLADLVTVKTLASGDSTPARGETVTFLISVTNNGAAQATNVSLADVLPPELTATGNNGTVSQGSFDLGTGTWTIGTLNRGSVATLTMEGIVVPTAEGLITNTTTAASTPDQIDPTTAGDDLTETVSVSADDKDGDGVPDDQDIDDDNDGIIDTREISSAYGGAGDSDGDSVGDHCDLDSDNDGISDLYESGNEVAIALDTNGDGTLSIEEAGGVGVADTDGDGLMDVFESGNLLVNDGTIPRDTDSDGLADYIDLDSDEDTIPDTVEARPTAGYVANDGNVADGDDTDGDGVINLFDTSPAFGGTHPNFSAPVNTDGDGSADFRDTDSDNDLFVDGDEAGPISFPPTYPDPDGSVDVPFSRLRNIDSDTTDVDYRSIDDKDLDGVPDTVDIDDDNDGILDDYEAGEWTPLLVNPSFETYDPADATTTFGSAPTRAMYIPQESIDGWSTTSTDGVIEIWETTFNGTPSFHLDAHAEINATQDAALYQDFVTTPGSILSWSIWHRGRSGLDTGRALIGDATEPISSLESVVDMATNNTEWVNYTGSYFVPAGQTLTRLAFESLTTATGNKSVGNFIDNLEISVIIPADSDGDGINNLCDLDSDNDGISDLYESGSLVGIAADTNGDGTISVEEADLANDGLLNGNADADNDGLFDIFDNDTLSADVTSSAGTTSLDTDSDGTPDFVDLDSDNDKIGDTIEARLTAGFVTNDGDVSNDDSDGDGVIDLFDTSSDFGGTHSNFNAPVNTDGDGLDDFRDGDSDNDTVVDIDEAGPISIPPSYSDPDGSVDVPFSRLRNIDSDTSDVDYRSLADKDGDGVTDSMDIDDDNDGILDTDEVSNAAATGGTVVTVVEEIEVSTFSATGPAGFASSVDSSLDGQVLNLNTGDSNNGTSVNVSDVIVYELTDPTKVVAIEVESNTGTEFEAGYDSNAPRLYFVGSGGKNSAFETADVRFRFYSTTDPDFSSASDLGDIAQVVHSGGGTPLTASVSIDIRDLDNTSSRIEGAGASDSDIDFYTLEDPSTLDPTTSDGFFFATGTIDNPSDALRMTFLSESSFVVRIMNSGSSNAGYTMDMTTSSTFSSPVVTTLTDDVDGDGVPDACDLDSDNDGISDLYESGNAAAIALDTNGDGMLDLTEAVDSDGDGLMDVFENGDLSADVGTTATDTDADGRPDYLDVDSDNDKIADTVEARPTGGYVNHADDGSTNVDSDKDGVLDIFDTNSVFGGTHPNFNAPNEDSDDADTVPDFLDTDSDGDGLTDQNEAGPIATAPTVTDPDGSIDNPYSRLRNVDSDTFDVDYRSLDTPIDSDSDGLLNSVDIDDDNDGILDVNEGGQSSGPTLVSDWTNILGSGISTGSGTMSFSYDSGSSSGWNQSVNSTDNSSELGYGNSFEFTFSKNNTNGYGMYGLTEDGGQYTGSYSDIDFAFYLWRDRIYIYESNSYRGFYGYYSAGDELSIEVDGSSLRYQHNGSTFRTVSIGSGKSYIFDNSIYNTSSFALTDVRFSEIDAPLGGSFGGTGDTDGDGVDDSIDLDSDNDGISDLFEGGPAAVLIAADTNGDGTISLAEAAAANGGVADADNDGLMDIFDANTANITPAASVGVTAVDTDSDMIPDFYDLDSDGDKIPDTIEARPTAGFATNDDDVSNDDTDGDGVIDLFDTNFVFGGTHANFIAPYSDADDTDDTVPDFRDLDSDGDTLPDADEAGPISVPPSYADPEGSVNLPFSRLRNLDGDGTDVDYRSIDDRDKDGIQDGVDIDDDNDGILDVVEGCGVRIDSNATRIVFILDTSGSISSSEYAAMVSSINQTATDVFALNHTAKIGIVQYGGGSSSTSSHTAAVTHPFSNQHPNLTSGDRATSLGVQDHLPASMFHMRPFFAAGGALDLTNASQVTVVIFTDAWKTSTWRYSVLFDDSPNNDPEAADGYGEYDFLKDTYNARLIVAHVEPGSPGGYEAAQAISSEDAAGNDLAILGSFNLSAEQTASIANGSVATGFDVDGDGIYECTDLDSDNDGISDLYESGAADAIIAADTNADGTITEAESLAYLQLSNPSVSSGDADQDGLMDLFDSDITTADETASAGTTPVDTDSDDTDDYIDLDSDNDTLPDTVEARATFGYVTNDADGSGTVADDDADDDGIINIFDANDGDGDLALFGGTHVSLITPHIDSDDAADALADFRDTDSDGDFLTDGDEAGSISVGPTYDDPDGSVSDPSTQFPNVDVDETDVDYRSLNDTDGDGVSNDFDLDDDNDGILDTEEAPSANISSWLTLGGTGLTTGDGTLTFSRDNAVSTAWNQSVNSTQSTVDLGYGDSFEFSFTADTTSGIRMIGLTEDGTQSSSPVYSDIDHAIYLYNGNTYVYESNSYQGNYGAFSAGNEFSIEVEGTTLRYQKNGTTFRTVSIGSGKDYIVDTSVYNTGSFTLSDLRVTNLDGSVAAANSDTDGDGVPNELDLDSDNDGISDLYESGAVSSVVLADSNEDGFISQAESLAYMQALNPSATEGDADNDGLMDLFDLNTSSTDATLSAGTSPIDTDGDGTKDFWDLDSDDDGLGDTIEARPTAGFVTNDDDVTDDDSDGDGVIDLFDSFTGFGGGHPNFNDPNTDSDDTEDSLPDYRDTDTDGDGLSDTVEAGSISVPPSYTDPEGSVNIPFSRLLNIDAEPSDVDYRSVADADGDGILDVNDIDDDNDGILDIAECDVPDCDTDMDGAANAFDLDSDNDGISDLYESLLASSPIPPADLNADGMLSPEETLVYLQSIDSSISVADADQDGLMDVFDQDITSAAPGASVGTNPLDSDADGTDDFLDLDSDNDTLPDTVEARPTAGFVTNDNDVTDDDIDGDGVIFIFDANDGTTGKFGGTHANFNNPMSTDADAIPDFRDPDADNDGIVDGLDAGPVSVAPTYVDPEGSVNIPFSRLKNVDTDPSDVDYRTFDDYDGDGVADGVDIDDDNDGIPDSVETGDTDGDGIADAFDLDSDNDGIADLYESGPHASFIAADADRSGTVTPTESLNWLVANIDAGITQADQNADGMMDAFDPAVNTSFSGSVAGTPDPVDTDGDGTDDYLDLDSDNDTIPDSVEARPTASFATNDGDVTDDDADGDGVIDIFDANDATAGGFGGTHPNFTAPISTDSDLVPDFRDTNSDADTFLDSAEAGTISVAPSYADPDGSVNVPFTDLLNVDGESADVDYRSVDAGTDLVTVKTLTSGDSTPSEGDTVTFQITVENVDKLTTNVTLFDPMPAGLTLFSSTPSTGSYSPASGLWTIGTLDAGDLATLTLSAVVNAGQGGNTITNTATAATSDLTELSNDGDDLTETIVVEATADLVTVTTLDSGDTTPEVGDTVRFHVTVTNNGAGNVSDAVLTDSLPAGLTPTGANGGVTHGSYDSATGEWSIGALADSETATLTLEGTIDVGQGGKLITNTTTTATATLIDPSVGGDDLTESIQVEIPALPSILGRFTDVWFKATPEYVATPEGDAGFDINSLSTGFMGRWAPVLDFVDSRMADVNGDGAMDIIGRLEANGDWWVTLGATSKRTPALWGNWDTSIAWANVLTGDFNGDGLADLVGGDPVTGDLIVAQSNGGSFTSTTWGAYDNAITWADVRVMDVDNDGLDDLIARDTATGDWWAAESTGTAFVMDMKGSWSAATDWAEVTVADFDGDGKDDLYGRDTTTSDWWIATTDAAGNLQSSIWGTRFEFTSLEWLDPIVLDLNGDGMDDLASRVAASGEWWVSISDGSSFTTNYFPGKWPAATDWQEVTPADLNGDGIMDIAGKTPEGNWMGSISNGSSFVLRNFGNFASTFNWQDFLIGDLDGDGNDDITARAGTNDDWWSGISNGNAMVNRFHSDWSVIADWSGTYVGELDGDGVDEIVSYVAQSGDLWVADELDGPFTVTKWDTWTLTNPEFMDSGDFDGDGLMDVAGLDSNGDWTVSLSTGSGFNTTVWGSWNPSLDWQNINVLDINGDGMDDVAGRSVGTSEWWLAVSDGSSFTVQSFGTWPAATTWLDVMALDANGDGLDDLIGRNQSTNEWMLSTSNGSSFTHTVFATWGSGTWNHVNSMDFNGDGKDDLVGQNGTDWWVSLSTGSAADAAAIVGGSIADLSHVQPVDLNVDGKSDLIGIQESTGRWYAIQSNGTNLQSEFLGTWPSISWSDVQIAKLS